MKRCTLTGADDFTNHDKLWEIGKRYLFVEWGILYSSTQQGKGRYPSFAWIEQLAKRLEQSAWPQRPQFALHICGRAVKDFIQGTGHVTDVAEPFNRIQLNFRARDFDLGDIRAMLERNAHRMIITQHNEANRDLAAQLAGTRNHAILFDASGGRGLLPETWPAPLPGVSCNYAGGLGPDNIELEVGRIHTAAAGQEYGLDMEGKLRDEQDRFNLPKAEQVLERLQATISTHKIGPWG